MNFYTQNFKQVSINILSFLLKGIVVCAFLGSPIAAHAGVFSFIENAFRGDAVSRASANVASEFSVPTDINSQNMSLLKAAANYDPNPTKGKTSPTIVSNSALLAFVGPTGTIADIEGIESHHIHVYEVQDGDTLSEIAAMFDVSIETVARTNHLKTTSAVRKGQNLIILPVSGVLYTVARGDTLLSIANKFDVSIEDIMTHNAEIYADSVLMVGDELIISNNTNQYAQNSDESQGSNTAKTAQTIKTAQTRKTSPSGALIAPAQVPEYYGYYVKPVVDAIRTQGLHGYNAVDFAHKAGTPIIASAAGQVIITASSGWNYGYGNYVVISHENGTQTLYAHLDKIHVVPGDTVEQSQSIGTMGSTGRSTGPHVHFEIRGAKNPF